MLWACPFLGERGVGEGKEETGTEGSTSVFESGVLIQQDLILLRVYPIKFRSQEYCNAN